MRILKQSKGQAQIDLKSINNLLKKDEVNNREKRQGRFSRA